MVLQNNELDQSKLSADIRLYHKYLQFFKYFYLLYPKNRRYFYLFNPFSMKKKSLLFALTCMAFVFVISGCSKGGDDTPAPKTKTELITKANWKFSDAKVSGVSVASFIQSCQKDNILTFLAAGTGTADEGATKCNMSDPQTNPFTWSFQTNETVLFVSTPFFSGGSSTFTIVSLTETELVVWQTITLSGVPQNVEVTFIH